MSVQARETDGSGRSSRRPEYKRQVGVGERAITWGGGWAVTSGWKCCKFYNRNARNEGSFYAKNNSGRIARAVKCGTCR